MASYSMVWEVRGTVFAASRHEDERKGIIADDLASAVAGWEAWARRFYGSTREVRVTYAAVLNDSVVLTPGAGGLD